MSPLLRRYLRLVIEQAHMARVPNQLVEPDGEEGDDEAEAVDEFSGAGAVAGYTAPLGADPDSMGRKKNKA